MEVKPELLQNLLDDEYPAPDKRQDTPPGDRMSRAYLESLTTDDLIKMADSLGLDIPYDLDRIFIIEELLDISSSDTDSEGAEGETDMTDLVLVESVPIPKQYNITFIEIMIRDPLWAFVFWEIKTQEKEQYEQDPDFDGYYLKITPKENSKNPARDDPREIFKVQIKPEDTAWYLSLNPDTIDINSRIDKSEFVVEICAGMKGDEIVLASSKPVKLPALPELPNKKGNHESGACDNPLLRLSGYGDFRILRSSERLLRSKRGAASDSNE